MNNPTVRSAASDAKDKVTHAAQSSDEGDSADLPGTAINPAHANV